MRKKANGAIIANTPEKRAVIAKNLFFDRHINAADKKIAGPTLNTPKQIPRTVVASPVFKSDK
ncbi:hypothetical protein OAJ39_02525 [Alphaproteobacteria bacterium]|nr:hypothetical protein [Alphaproteobacteria bacterium]